ncbi:MAG: hypothetical protein ACRELC_08000 [Gemmatimonadota bacterium]
MTDVGTSLRRASQLVEVPARPFERLVERRDSVRRRQRLSAFATALVVAAGSLGGVGVLVSRVSEGPTAPASAWEPSRRLVLRPGEYFYLRITSDEATDGHVRDVETWWASDGSGEVRNRSTRQDKYPYPPSGIYADGRFPTYLPDVASLSTDPSVLAAELEHTPYGWESLLLEAPNATPELRAALFAVASGIEGVTVIDDVRDLAGRPAVALEYSERDAGDTATWRMYFDPGTHQAIAWTFVSSRGGEAWLLLESAMVDTRGGMPTADDWLVPPIAEATP